MLKSPARELKRHQILKQEKKIEEEKQSAGMLEMRCRQISTGLRGGSVQVNYNGGKSGTEISGTKDEVQKLKQALIDYTTNP